MKKPVSVFLLMICLLLVAIVLVAAVPQAEAFHHGPGAISKTDVPCVSPQSPLARVFAFADEVTRVRDKIYSQVHRAL